MVIPQANISSKRMARSGRARLAVFCGMLAMAGSVAGCTRRDEPRETVDPGAVLFAENCAECHAWDGHNGLGGELPEESSAPDLRGFGSADWIDGLLDPERIAGPEYFGRTAFAEDSKMVEFVVKEFRATPEERREVAEALAEQGEGWKSVLEEALCFDCHSAGAGDSIAMDLSGYGSREWTIDFISDPAAEHFYGDSNDRMPSFKKENLLSREQIESIADWLLSAELR